MYIPLRMCAACRRHAPKAELIRIAARDDTAVPDAAGKLPGRGMYVCKNADCIRLLEKKRIVGRQLRCEPAKELYKVMEDML